MPFLGGASMHKNRRNDNVPSIPGIRHTAQRGSTPSDASPSKSIALRPSQRTAWEHLRDWDCGILNAPTGWGKSMVLCTLAADDLIDDPRRKVIVTIPQRGLQER
jgi:superfamily II DNA or RNA helicase